MKKTEKAMWWILIYTTVKSGMHQYWLFLMNGNAHFPNEMEELSILESGNNEA